MAKFWLLKIYFGLPWIFVFFERFLYVVYPPPQIEAIHQQLQGTALVCLMPNYNKKETIEKAIRSVLMQKTDFPFKLIVTDDHSTDGSYEIAVELAKQNPEKIIVTRAEKNGGILERTLEGYAYLKGVEYFCVLDSDDWYIYPKKFQDAVHFLNAHPDYTGYFASVLWLKKNDQPNWEHLNHFYLQSPPKLDFDWNDYKAGKGMWVQTSGAVFRNIYCKNEVPPELLNATSLEKPYRYCFCADGFRVPWHVKKGRTFFINRIESVYDYHGGGDWSNRSEIEQSKSGVIGGFAFADFFGEKDADYFYKGAQTAFENLLKLLHQNPEQIAEYQDFLLEFFPKIYLNPQYNAFEPAYPAELLPFIQWALDKTQLQLRSKLQLRTRLKRLIGRA